MDKEILTFGNIEIEKSKFHRHKTSIHLGDVDVEKVLVSDNISFGEKNYKYFIGYLLHNYKVKPLHIMPPKTTDYVKSYDGQTKWMYLLMEDDDILEKYNTIWDKVSADIKKEFDGEPVYNNSYMKTKIKSHDKEGTDFYDKKFPNSDSNDTSLAMITLDSALKKYANILKKKYLGIFMVV